MMMEDYQFTIYVYECGNCGHRIAQEEYEQMIYRDIECPTCGQRLISDYIPIYMNVDFGDSELK